MLRQMASHSRPTKPKLSSLRRVIAIGGILGLVGLGFAGHSIARVPLTAVAWGSLLFAALLVLLEVRRASSSFQKGIGTTSTSAVLVGIDTPSGSLVASQTGQKARRWPGLPAVMGVFLVTLGASQTWFISGTALAGGDIAPPVGTAWLSRLFEPWVWSGANLGGPNTLPIDLPWAVVEFLVHSLGGSGALAQRIWLSGLFVGAALACYWLLRVLNLSPVAAAAGALVWVFNPYVVADVGMNDVYLAAMVLVAVWPGVLLQAARGRWRIRWALLVFLVSAPLAGFVYNNPPLLGLAALGAAVAVLFASLLDGWDAARRGLLGFLGGFVVLAGASAFWLVPSLQALNNIAPGLASTSSWGWTEGRVAVANGFWLNTVWGWSHRLYYPYAYLYNELPLSLVKYLLPSIAFSSLALIGPLNSARQRRRAQLAAFAALVSLFLIFFGTGTVAPGSMIFDPIYHLPLGWLLQDPGRFLMAAALGYATMAAVSVEIAVEFLVSWARGRVSGYSLARRTLSNGRRGWLTSLAPTTAVAVVVLVGAFPVAVGSMVPRFGHAIPESHVKIPKYWTKLAAQINQSWPRATVVVLPPNDFYQMPYTWYYGNNNFITDLLSAHVLDPSSEGYMPSSDELLRAVDQLAGALLGRRWQEATDIMNALGATQMLVRGDINASYPGTHIIPPVDLMNALTRDPQVRLLDRVGPLSLYGLAQRYIEHARAIVTVNTKDPDLAVLGDLAPGSALVAGPLIPGRPSVLQTPPLSSWKAIGRDLEINEEEPQGFRYKVVTLPSLQRIGAKFDKARYSQASIINSRALPDGSRRVTLRVPLGPSLIDDGDFSKGLWGPVGNCNAVPGTASVADLHAEVVAGAGPGGSSALQLSARADRGCEAQTLHWKAGAILVSLWYRTLKGEGAGLCVWQAGPNYCATGVPTLASAPGWHHVQFEVIPVEGTKKLVVFLYATPNAVGFPAIAQYADVSVHLVLQDGRPVLIGYPAVVSPAVAPGLVVSKQGFSAEWSGPSGAQHVLVNGLRNGWIVVDQSRAVVDYKAVYMPTQRFVEAEMLSLVIAASVVSVLVLMTMAEWWRRRS